MPSAGVGWPIGKDVTKVRITGCASDFNPNHPMRDVPDAGHLFGFNFTVETGPAASGIEFGCSGIQRSVAHFTVVSS